MSVCTLSKILQANETTQINEFHSLLIWKAWHQEMCNYLIHPSHAEKVLTWKVLILKKT